MFLWPFLIPINCVGKMVDHHLKRLSSAVPVRQRSSCSSSKEGSTKDEFIKHLLRSMCFFTVFYNVNIQAVHIPGSCNSRDDQLSRNNLHMLFMFNPQASQSPYPLPCTLLDIMGTMAHDWTSQIFIQLFHTTKAEIS